MPRDQDQFLDVTDRDLAERRWHAAIRPHALAAETIPLSRALGRVLAGDVISDIDVPGFDRSNLDGYALRAEDTFGTNENVARLFDLNNEDIHTGIAPTIAVLPGTASPIATGGMLPRGADAVAMVEITSIRGDRLAVKKAVSPGSGVSFAGTDVARGELVLRKGTTLTSRETGVLAAIGRGEIAVIRRPRVAILSTGDEIVAPGSPLPLGSVYDSNATILSDAVSEVGGEPISLGIVGDDQDALDEAIDRGLASSDLLLMSGGTSKGSGDLSYRVLARRTPGIVVHGVALKPGKPICLGAIGDSPVIILPGFPTSAVFTFHEFVAPVIRTMAGRRGERRGSTRATMAARVNSERGRTEYGLVNLVEGPTGLSAYPMGKGSGSVTSYGRADGFVTIARDQEFVDIGETVEIEMLGAGTEAADLIAIGSHCSGLDFLLGLVAARGFSTKTIWVGSTGGLLAAGRGECDVAGLHLLDPASGEYNRSFLPDGVRLRTGYGRMQGVVYREGDRRFPDLSALSLSIDDPAIAMVNRNRGSGTRVLIDGLIGGRKPPGFAVEARSHNAVCAAVAQGRADWGVAIEPVSRQYGLGFLPIREERYDFAIPESRWDRPAVAAFREIAGGEIARSHLKEMGFS